MRDIDIEQAYNDMERSGYTPIPGPHREGARRYAERFRGEESAGFHIGSPDKRTAAALVFTIEAARCMCAISNLDYAPMLLRMAIAALERDNPSACSPGRSVKLFRS
ncbi:MAG TPA: hypothetical protein VKX49_04335 [Bryobacteraceae bacterium]|nr:hypothetical protein [Bryobacteraceae bacterium]